MSDYTSQFENVYEAIEHIDAVASKVSAAIDDVDRHGSPADAAHLFQKLENVYNKIDKVRKSLFHLKDKMSKQVFPGVLDRHDQDLARIPELGRSYYILTKFSAKTHDAAALMQWLRDQGDGDIITETVNAQTLAGYLKTKMLDDGVEAPEDVASLTSYRIIGSSKYTPK